MKYKATKKFERLGIDNSYQGLNTKDYYSLKAGNVVDIEDVPSVLLEENYVEKITETKKRGL